MEPEALLGLEAFSHVEVVFVFHLVEEASVCRLDAIDGTPVLDVKPYMSEFGARGEVRQPEWATELMAGYWTAE